jgi:hypothetical protein
MKPPIYKRLGLPKPRPLARLHKPGDKPARKAPVQWEEAYQRTVAEFLDWALPPGTVWFAVPNGGKRSKAVAAKLKAGGVKPGVADIIIIYRGDVYGLELKVRGGTQSNEQVEWEGHLHKAGGFYLIARDTIDDVQRCLEIWSIPCLARRQN